MSSSNIFTNFVIILFIFHHIPHTEAQQKEPVISVNLDENWDSIEEGWPLQNYFDRVNEVKAQFYYSKNSRLTDFTLKLKDSILDQIEDQNQLFRVSFKYWLKHEPDKGFRIIIKLGDTDDKEIEYLSESIDQWMSRLYVLTLDQLKNFRIQFQSFPSSYFRITALKDFKIEYQEQNNFARSVSSLAGYSDSNASLIGWTQYKIPPTDPNLLAFSFIYFPKNCTNNCVLTFENIDTNIKEAKLSFKYWLNGKDSKIQFKGLELVETDPKIWSSQTEITITAEELENLQIVVTTGTVDSYAAIRDLKVVLVYNETENAEKPLDCTPENCPRWNFSELPFWGQKTSLLEPLTEYFVPTSSENWLIIKKEDNLNSNNVCLDVEYFLLNERESKLNIDYNIEEEDKTETILEIRPKIGYKKSTKLCLRQLIASNAGKYQIVFNSVQKSYENILNSLHIRIVDNSTLGEEWLFSSERQNYLVTSGNLWTAQWVDLTSDQDLDSNFEFLTNPIKFSAKTKSKMPTTAYLSSVWIKYDSILNKTDPTYNITVTDPKELTKFTIRPKICDWLSHCNDVLLSPESLSALNTQTFSFKFPELKNSEYFRLVFQVDYFKPLSYPDTDSEVAVNFELDLLNFGDPCFEHDQSLCNGANGECYSDPKTSTPNEPTCKCKPEFEDGQSCKDKNYCFSENTNGQIGSTTCSLLGLSCESLANNFRCICAGNSTIIWDSTECKTITPDISDKSWTETPEGGYYPNKKDNLLKYKILNINGTAYDVCLKLEYDSSQTVNLAINFTTTEFTQEIAHIPLILSSETELADITYSDIIIFNSEFCLSDFYRTDLEQFELNFRIDADLETWNKTAFILKSITPSLVEKKTELPRFLDRWDKNINKSNPNPAFDQTWKTFPDTLFEKSTDDQVLDFKFSVNAETPVPSKAYLISDWIKNDQNFSQSENYYSLSYTKDSINKIFQLKQSYIYVENNLTVTDTKIFTGNNPDNIELLVPPKQESPFKLIFEINILHPSDKNEWFLTFQNLSLGDPCFVYSTGESVCENGGLCKGIAPKQSICDCTGTKYDGPTCELKNSCENKDNDQSEETNEQFCSSMPSLPDNSFRKCRVLTDDTFECICPQNDYFWDSTKRRCLRNGYSTQIYECLANECEFLDNLFENMIVSHKNIPVLTQINDPILPFYYTSNKDSTLQINIKELSDKTDVRFNLKYQISQNSKLGISYQELGTFPLMSTQTTKDNINWFPSTDVPETFCVTNLTKTISKEFNISFNANVNDQVNDIVVLKLVDYYPVEIDESLKNELPYLTHWSLNKSDKDFAVDNQWSIRYPGSFWKIPTEKPDSIEFTYLGSDTPQKAYLLSNWINKDVEGYKLRFKFKSNSEQNFTLNVITFNEKMEETFFQVIEEQEEPHVIPFDKIDTYFRIGFSVEVKYSESIKFSLESIDFGDPCIEDNTEYNTCSGGNGTCMRITEGNKLNFKCNCSSNIYTGTYCEAYNYCEFKHEIVSKPGDSIKDTNGREYCDQTEGHLCINSYPDRFGNFSCECDQDKFWNINKLLCSKNPKCITKDCDYETQECKEPTADETEAICVCKKGYVNLGEAASPKCEVFDPCNNEHRKIIDVKKEILCEDPFAKCKAFGHTIDEYMCICENGFKTIMDFDKSKTSCKFISCSFPSLNNCKQTCVANTTQGPPYYECTCADKFYELAADKMSCILKSNVTRCNCGTDDHVFCNDSEKCQCRDGYNAVKSGDDSSYHCQPNVAEINHDVCPGGKLNKTEDNELACQCSDGFDLDPEKKTCTLRPICGENGEGRADCEAKNALCIYIENELGKYKCECPSGLQDLGNGTCIDVCEYKVEGKSRNSICKEIHGKCNPLLYDPNIEQNEADFCECGPGYTRNESNCLIAEFVSQFSLRIKNTFKEENSYEDLIPTNINENYYYDLNTFTEDLKFANQENRKVSEQRFQLLKNLELKKYLSDQLKPIFKLISTDTYKWYNFEMNECQLQGDYYECKIAINAKIGDNDLGEKLLQLCNNLSVPLDTECFFSKFPNNNLRIISSNTDSELSLIIDRQELENTKLGRYSNCEAGTDVCGQYDYTNCRDSGGEDSLYSCVCNEYDIISEKNETLPTSSPISGSTAYLSICKVNQDLCSVKCPETIFNCTQMIPYKNHQGIYVAPVNCKCDVHFLPNVENTECVSVCAGHNCKSGKCQPTGTDGYACLCDEGWSGAECNVELKTAIGGWIAGITVLAVICFALIAVTFIFARRSNRLKLDQTNNSQPMNQYSPTSYRVGQNQYNNEAFTRD